jgi:hypothetical protein
MAADFKKLLVSYIDKIIFVAFLVLFLVSAFRVVMSGPSHRTSVPPVSKKEFPPPEELYEQRYVLNSLKNPNEPDATNDFTSDPEKSAPGPGEKQCPLCGWIVPRAAPRCPHCLYSWTGEIIVKKDDEEKPKEPLPKGVPFRVLEITRKPVDILFKGFVENPFKLRFDLQMHWGMGTKMSIVPLGEMFRGYGLYPLEKKVVEVNDPKMGPRKEDRYFLTIQKPGEEPLIVERGKIVREREARAVFDAGQGRWDITHRDEKIASAESYFEVYAQYQLAEIGGEARKFEVLAVKDAEGEVVLRNLRDPEQKEIVLKLELTKKKPKVASEE